MAKIFLVAVCGLAIILMVFASEMIKPLGHDENMYCTAGALTAQGKMIYRDFSYVTHPPYHAFLLAAVYTLFDTAHYLLAARLVSISCDCLAAVIIFLIIARIIFRNAAKEGIYLGLASVVLYTFNPFVNYAGGFAWNHSVIMLCVVASFWLYASTNTEGSLNNWRVAAVAALLTFAMFSRMTVAPVWLLFLIFFLLKQSRKFQILSIFLSVSLLVAFLPLYIIAQAPKAFYLDAVINPLLNGQYLHRIGMAYSKPQMMLNVLTEPVYAVTALISLALWLAAFVNRSSLSTADSRNMMLALLLAVISFAVALIPLTVWHQYFAMPIPFLIISCAYPLAHFAVGKRLKHVGITAAAVIIFSAAVNPWPLAAIPSAFSVPDWVPMQVHSIASDIAAKAGKGKRILTLAPLFAIEGGCQIYPELSAGPFAYRVADLMTAEDRAAAKIAGPSEIAQLAQQNPPSGIFLGTEPPQLEEPLRKIAPPDWKTQTYLDSRLLLLYPNSNLYSP